MKTDTATLYEFVHLFGENIPMITKLSDNNKFKQI